MRRMLVVAACVIGLLWVAPVTGTAPAPAHAAAATAAGTAGGAASAGHIGAVPPVSGMTDSDPRV
jgi:hypothetical protein